MIIPYKSSFGPIEVEVEVFDLSGRIRAAKRVNSQVVTMFSGSKELWDTLKSKGWVND